MYKNGTKKEAKKRHRVRAFGRSIKKWGAIEKSPILDRAERYDFGPRLWLFSSPILFPPNKRGKKKRRKNSKNRD